MSRLPESTTALVGALDSTHDVPQHRQFEEKLLMIADEERRRIGLELHDVLGQELLGLAFTSDALMEALREHSSQEVKLAENLKDGIKLVLNRVRTEAWGLIPIEIEARELGTALTGLSMQISERFGIECQFNCPTPVALKRNHTATNLYRIVQEAVTNAIKHGHAHRIAVTLCSNNDQIRLEIQDDGLGLQQQSSTRTGQGLQIMRFRARSIEATLDLQEIDTGGVRVVCTLKEEDC